MAPKIYHLHPLVAGPLAEWPVHFARCRAMGFNTVCVAPPFAPGGSGDIFVTGDHETLHPALGWQGSADEGIARITQDAAAHGLRVWLDLAIDRVAVDAPIRRREEAWFAPGGCGGLPNPWRPPHRLDVAYARLEQTEIAEALIGWWLDRLERLLLAGVAGFRCLEPDHMYPGALAADHRHPPGGVGRLQLPRVDTRRGTRGAGPHGRRRLRSCLLLAWMVGRTCELAGR